MAGGFRQQFQRFGMRLKLDFKLTNGLPGFPGSEAGIGSGDFLLIAA
jgi:hypothetical protein